MKKEKTTVLLVNKNHEAIAAKRVPGHVITNWKKYIALFSVITLLLFFTIGYLILDRKNSHEKQLTLKNEINNLHRDIAQIDTITIKERFSSINKEIETINKYLRARGINETLTIPQGGEDDESSLTAADLGQFYQEYLASLSTDFAEIPLGYPYKGAITSHFGYRSNPFGTGGVEGHPGLDIRAPMGAPVRTMAKGKIVFAGKKGGYGNCIIIKHAGGYETLYGHLSRILVRSGQQVEVGDRIGKVGSTGRSTGPHLHYEIRKNGKKVNPKPFLSLN